MSLFVTFLVAFVIEQQKEKTFLVDIFIVITESFDWFCHPLG